MTGRVRSSWRARGYRHMPDVPIKALDVSVPRRIAALGLTLVALCCLPAAAQASEPFSFGYTDDWPENSHLIAPAAQNGAKVGRQFMCWCGIEPSRGVYDWRLLDQLAFNMAASGMRPLLVIYGSPAWARSGGDTLSPPSRAHDADWRRLFQRLAERYPSLVGVEVMNEPNLAKFFTPAADPVRYTELLKLAYAGVQAGRPSLPVLLGAPTGNVAGPGNIRDVDFLQAVYRQGGRGSFDAIAAHPYPEYGGAPVVGTVRDQLDALRFVRNVNGDGGKPIWVTEVGISTTTSTSPSPPHAIADEGGQAEGLARIYRALRAMPDVPVGLVFRYSDVLPRLNPAPWSAQSGVVRLDGSPKLARGALVAAQANPAENRPRVAVTAAPNPVKPRQAVRITANWIGGFGAAQYAFDLNANGVIDTPLGSSNSATTSFTTPGVKTIAVFVQSFWDRWRTSVRVNVGTNQLPIAKFDVRPRRTRYLTSQPITFDPARSSDPDGRLVSFRWSIYRRTLRRGRPVYTRIRLSGRRLLQMRIQSPGTYSVRLAVKDNNFVLSPSRSRTIQVQRPPRRVASR